MKSTESRALFGDDGDVGGLLPRPPFGGCIGEDDDSLLTGSSSSEGSCPSGSSGGITPDFGELQDARSSHGQRYYIVIMVEPISESTKKRRNKVALVGPLPRENELIR